MSDLILALDGSTYAATVALLDGSRVVAERAVSVAHDEKGSGRGEMLAPLIAECLKEAGHEASELKRIVCGAGPGSFTSLRVAASIGKGIAVAAGAELYTVSSLALTVAGLREAPAAGRYLSTLSAMRGESFALLVEVGAKGISAPGSFNIVPDGDLAALASSEQARMIGPGRQIDATPHARGAARLFEAIISSGPVDLASWEPDYGRLAEAQVKWEAAHGRPLSP